MAVTETLVANKLQVALAGMVLLGGAGATYVALGGDIPFLDSDQMADQVPEDVDMVMYVSPNVAEDETTKELVNGFIDIAKDENESYAGPDDYEEWLEEAETDSNTSLDMDELNSVMVYMTYPDSAFSTATTETPEDAYVGVIVDSEWGEEKFMDEVENGTEYEKGEYEGYTVYEQQNASDNGTRGWVGVLSNGQYVLGTEDAVEDAIDVDRGAAESFGGDLRTAYDNTRSGSSTYLKFAAKFPEDDQIEDAGSGMLNENQFRAFKNIKVFSGSYYTNGDEIGMQMRLETETEQDADDLAAILDGSFALYKQLARTDEMHSLMANIEVEQDGTAVTMTFERPAEKIVGAVEAAIDEWSSLGPSTASGSGFGTNASDGTETDDSRPGSQYALGADGLAAATAVRPGERPGTGVSLATPG